MNNICFFNIFHYLCKKKIMTRDDALILLHNGKKVTHTYFMNNEYVYIDKKTGVITTDDGFDFSEQWWKYDKFKDGWTEYIYKMSKREKAMNWWNNLSSSTKTRICDNTTHLVGNVRRWETLTGNEIEKLLDSVRDLESLTENEIEKLYKINK